MRNDAAGNVSFGEITYTMEDVFGADPLDGESVSGGSDASGGEAGAPSEMGASSEAEVPSEVTPTSEVAPAERTRVFRYTISESGTVPGIANDPDIKTVEVTVADNGGWHHLGDRLQDRGRRGISPSLTRIPSCLPLLHL